MTTFRWLHLTDLHLGMPGQDSLWPNVEEQFLDDLKFLHDNVGPWNLVLFTGDLTQRGSAAEFAAADELLQKFWSHFGEWGFAPEFLAIPGNHDLVRPQDGTDPALLTLLHNWHLPAVQRPFWEDENSPQRRLVSGAFRPFADWWQRMPIPKPATIKTGLLPGDCSASFGTDEFRVGVVGLNSAYLQLAEGDFNGRLHVDARQLNTACDGHAADWTKRHDACLLLTHHPVEWLNGDAQKHFADEIHFPPERFALHLFGHMHEGGLTSLGHGGGDARRRFQACSLFGLEGWGAQNANGVGAQRQAGNRATPAAQLLRLPDRFRQSRTNGGHRGLSARAARGAAHSCHQPYRAARFQLSADRRARPRPVAAPAGAGGRPVGWQDYRDLLRYNLKKALPSRLASLTGHNADFYSTLQISEQVFAEEPRLREIVDVLTWSAPTPMGLDLLASLLGVADRAELTGALGLGTRCNSRRRRRAA